MVVLIVERAPAALRGELSRWMIEPRVGVFVGKVSAMVRDKLWEKVASYAPEVGATMIHSAQTEQGFRVRTEGETSRRVVNLEGLELILVPKEEQVIEQHVRPRRRRASSGER